MSAPRFHKTVIGELENSDGGMNTLFNIGDLNNDGLPDIFTSGRSGRMAWFQNPGRHGAWRRHIIDQVTNLECGGLSHDLTGSGYEDVIDGGDWQSSHLWWWENPGPSNRSWVKRLIFDAPGRQFHDELIGDVTGDGRQSLLFTNQGCQTLFWTLLPADPRKSPWRGVQPIAAGLVENGQPEEGLAIADLDNDGQNEVIAGTHWYKYRRSTRTWEQHKYASGYITTVIAVGDIDGDGRLEIVLAEGDACIYGHPEGGKLAWFKPDYDIRKPWIEHRIDEGLLDPHSVQLAGLCGSGRPDIVVGEIGVKERYTQNPPRLMVYENDGGGMFTRHIVDVGTGTHHARVADFRGIGCLDIASRPLHGDEKWKIHVFYNARGGPMA